GNDDAIRSCSVVVKAIADGIEAGKKRVTENELKARSAKNGDTAEPAAEPEAEATPVADAPSEAAPAEAAPAEAPAAPEPAAEPAAAAPAETAPEAPAAPEPAAEAPEPTTETTE